LQVAAEVLRLEERCLLSGGKVHLGGARPHVETGLTITPIFSDAIKNSPDAEKIEKVIKEAIADYKKDFTNPIDVKIEFTFGGALGSSRANIGLVPYTTYLAALKKHATSLDQKIALEHLPVELPSEPYNQDPSKLVRVSQALGRALRIQMNPSETDGTVYFNPDITTPPKPADKNREHIYDLKTIIEHEIDEVLGLTSYLGQGAPIPGAWDLFRYGPDGRRSFTLNRDAEAYFSIDGKTHLEQFSQKGSPYDYGDWAPSLYPIRVQNSQALPIGIGGKVPLSKVELTALNVIGYTLRDRA
jgi:hypothetical protein